MSWKQKIKEDRRYRHFVKRFTEEWATAFDIEQLDGEIRALHLNRTIGRLNLAEDHLLRRLSEASVQDQANRSRLCRIKLEINSLSSRLDRYREALQGYLVVTLNDELNDAGYRSKDAKYKAVSSLTVFQQAAELQGSLNYLWANCDIVINDIDQAHFTAQRLLKAVEISSQREVTL